CARQYSRVWLASVLRVPHSFRAFCERVGNYPALQFSTTVVILEFAAFANEGSGRAARCLASCARQQPRVWPASILGSFSASLRRSPKTQKPPRTSKSEGAYSAKSVIRKSS